MTDINRNTQEILDLYGNSMSDTEKFYHLLEQIEKHVVKISKLKEKEDKPGHFKEEVADIHLLTKTLVKLEDINDGVLHEASDHYLEKIKELFG